ncbi:SDR family NAD(P)-dependent oxidoreductase [Poriferisphaera sp. WC338]|uniref:SDR family NAD(P)-dependent oxidoreductase n=1 Tax=Poriferisphaera sp. WC338 TaxID=3425129 RepID=UPI003D812903
MTRNLQGKVIVITGASSGIGAATAIECGKHGMKIILNARRENKLHAIAEKVKQAGGETHVVTGDVGIQEDVDKLMHDSHQAFGRMDIVFANAGYGLYTSVLDMTEEEHRKIFEVNYFGTVRTIKAAHDYMTQTPDGLKQYLITSSVVSEVGLPMFGAYAATKAAQDSIASALRGELASEGFEVTSVHPAGTSSEFFDQVDEKSVQTRGVNNTPKHIMQTPQQVAKKIVKAIIKPKAEVWPMKSVHVGVSFATLFPGLTASFLKKHADKLTSPQNGH